MYQHSERSRLLSVEVFTVFISPKKITMSNKLELPISWDTVNQEVARLELPLRDEFGDFGLVFWQDKKYGVVPMKEICDLEPTPFETRRGAVITARFGKRSYKALFVHQGSSEKQLYELAKVLHSMRRKSTKSGSANKQTVNSGKRKNEEQSGPVEKQNKETKKAKKDQCLKRAEVAHLEARNLIQSLRHQVHESVHAPACVSTDSNIPLISSPTSCSVASVSRNNAIECPVSVIDLEETPTSNKEYTTFSHGTPVPSFSLSSNMTNSETSEISVSTSAPLPHPVRTVSISTANIQQPSLYSSTNNNNTCNQIIQSSPNGEYRPFIRHNMSSHPTTAGSTQVPSAFSPITSSQNSSVYYPPRNYTYNTYPPFNPEYQPNNSYIDSHSSSNNPRVSPSALNPLTYPCPECILKDNKIDSLNIYVRNLEEQNRAWESQYSDLKDKYESIPSPYSRTPCSDGTPAHYLPKRGPQVTKADVKYFVPGEAVPDGYQAIGDNVAVPSTWLTETLAKCVQKPSSYTVKLLLNGLYHPCELSEMSSSELVKTDLGRALRLFAIVKLKMTDAQFNHAVNSKKSTVKRAIKLCRVPEQMAAAEQTSPH